MREFRSIYVISLDQYIFCKVENVLGLAAIGRNSQLTQKPSRYTKPCTPGEIWGIHNYDEQVFPSPPNHRWHHLD